MQGMDYLKEEVTLASLWLMICSLGQPIGYEHSSVGTAQTQRSLLLLTIRTYVSGRY